MTVTLKALLDDARSNVTQIDAAEARRRADEDGALLLDVRDPSEVAQSGKASGALNVSRGMLEFRADPASPYYNDALRPDRPVILYCASGGRAVLAARTLIEMGYTDVSSMGGFKDYAEAGLACDAPA
ncbi:hypothetical protein OCGS_1979 [Oceaniovalibus guishaninsula JLT2003]|uniref:Rhodanese domain-containing protein n=1 Tax=Oceaniovalibus guishaninsula JLT2003 TaxID=1231392 RepID=K2H8U3_9RHOB|nr:rhodanese-like domain-containing protein [Oceaniovalibus guishaninsula]EKE43998.1 hypothetical protein OCGS_1979 [Oceaniovalibus guishaninsula JLT2003]